MERTGFYGLNDSYESCGFDCGGTSILVETDNVTKSVSVGGCTSEPVPGFTEVVTVIREAVADPISR